MMRLRSRSVRTPASRSAGVGVHVKINIQSGGVRLMRLQVRLGDKQQ